MNVLISGCNGLIGSMVRRKLEENNHEVKALTRAQPGASLSSDEIGWNPETFVVYEPDKLEGINAVIHLAGEPIIGRWTPNKKQAIYRSRVVSTAALARAMAALQEKPSVIIVASAIGFYGDRGSRELSEEDTVGTGYLPHVCSDWEEAAYHAREANIRVVHARMGIVLSAQGGALKKMLPPFKLGLGGRIGSGMQYMSWIALDDVVGGLLHCLQNESLHGPVNFVAPNPVTNRQFTETLAHALNRPALFPVPAFLLRLLMGEMADALLLASARVKPSKLLDSGYKFQYSELGEALQGVLTKN
jgi:uncharacterized protein